MLRPSHKPLSFYEPTASVCAKYITHLFASAKYPPSSPFSAWQSRLPHYITFVMRLSNLNISVVLAAMTLLRRYKQYLPHSISYGDDAHRLFITSYILASKVICDKPRKMSFWRDVSGKKFSCRELVQMEREFCMVLRWELQIDQAMYTLFQVVVDTNGSQDFCHWNKTTLHIPSSPPRYREFEPSLGGTMKASSYLRATAISFQRFSVNFEVEPNVRRALRHPIKRLLNGKFLPLTSRKSSLCGQ